MDDHKGEPYPVGRKGHAAVCLDYGDHSQLFMTGGCDNGINVLSDAWMLDVQSGRWREVSYVVCADIVKRLCANYAGQNSKSPAKMLLQCCHLQSQSRDSRSHHIWGVS